MEQQVRCLISLHFCEFLNEWYSVTCVIQTVFMLNGKANLQSLPQSDVLADFRSKLSGLDAGVTV